MKILMCASEVAPFTKTGGLADVTGALSAELGNLDHDIRIVTPLHGSIPRSDYELQPVVEQLGVPLGFGEQWCAVWETRLPGTSVPVYLIEHAQYFGRTTLYQHDGNDYADNAERFAFFARACCQLCKALRFSPDVMHCHDWQAALVSMYLKTWDADHPLLWSCGSVVSIHNLGYQGVFPKDEIIHCQLGWERFTVDGLEYYDQLNYLKGGVLYADKISTVSPTYAHEIQTPEHGWGLDAALRARSADLIGILNGCDYREWDPSHDQRLPATYDVSNMAGKVVCKRELQRRFGLPVRDDVPIIGMVTRLAYQKGIDVLAEAMPAILELDLQFIVLGTGEVWAHFFYGALPEQHPSKVGAHIGFDETLARCIVAGSDFFLMPSRYEPCGLGQLHAMRYGSIPIARATGGLVDTVEEYDEATGAGDGLTFVDLDGKAIANSVGWAVSTFYDRPHHVEMLRAHGMCNRFSWLESAKKYVDLYGWAAEHKRYG